ncbi:MAG: ATP-binding protein [cyanobacterium endosymbiont of Rhopalodia musculus]|uniref:ATP-binding protein n=1 Tax=cyanobacterium endosymbiont of Epithemia clementina EcSB TaxID=3034674 RepID=UPI0024818511|nr:ATP-binding protein [cyanobacterium endosymbiont of Epithemia clementina EcSB]WGT67781.1 ATP-binding protein [cyanobacterium endosymbiont of Epithemia clementina EcSB]
MNQLKQFDDFLYPKISSLLLYQSIFKSEVGQTFICLLYSIYSRDKQTLNLESLKAYGNFFNALARTGKSWQDYLISEILLNENPFSQQVQSIPFQELPKSLIDAVKHDLSILQIIYNCTTQQIAKWVKKSTLIDYIPVVWELENIDNTFLHRSNNWQDTIEELADYYNQEGTGIIAKYKVLKWERKQLIGINNPDPIQLTEIVGYDPQKETLIKNTEILLAGCTALNVLLYGSRGSGKSSLIKGLLNKYSSKGLRLVEVSKSQLNHLPWILDKLRNYPQKFIVFVDDLSFEEDDDTFKSLKVVLEGSVTARADNVVVYATSNRKHLIREFVGDRPQLSDFDEVHAWDTVQEKLSFSDRFGLTLTFEPANQEKYLTIVNYLAQQIRLDLPQEELEFRAKQWAMKQNGRSGRTARQFIHFLQGELKIND